jgi:hypothetical protein
MKLVIPCDCGRAFDLSDPVERDDWVDHVCPVLGSWDD